MAASYSSFLTTQYYSPIFNTALFDGPFRIYFSQSYESVALKIYHLLQTQDHDMWKEFKLWSEKSKEHAFILIYPSDIDLKIAFNVNDIKTAVISQEWTEGYMSGMSQPATDESFKAIYDNLVKNLKNFIEFKKSTTNFHVSIESELA